MTLATGEIDLVRQIVLERAGIALTADQGYRVEARLEALARREGIGTTSEVVDRVRRRADQSLTDRLVESLTTNETSFFRDPPLFDALAKEMLPGLILARTRTRELSIWSAASSTGQEAYTVAILLREKFPSIRDWKVTVIGTDLSDEVLARAREGRFSPIEANRGMPAALLIRYFTKVGVDWQVKPEVRAMVQFQKLNLVGTWPALPVFDIVFLRNVLIYFSVATKQQVIRHVRTHLARDGYLLLGAAETLYTVDDSFERIQWNKAAAYRRLH